MAVFEWFANFLSLHKSLAENEMQLYRKIKFIQLNPSWKPIWIRLELQMTVLTFFKLI